MGDWEASRESLGESPAFMAFQEHLSRAARVNRPVLIMGERGSGKELAARRLHFLSPRWREPLVTLNCAALPPTLLETELFGHEAGAFTGAAGQRKGRFEEADGGTLFLDEIGLIPPSGSSPGLRGGSVRSHRGTGSRRRPPRTGPSAVRRRR